MDAIDVIDPAVRPRTEFESPLHDYPYCWGCARRANCNYMLCSWVPKGTGEVVYLTSYCTSRCLEAHERIIKKYGFPRAMGHIRRHSQ